MALSGLLDELYQLDLQTIDLGTIEQLGLGKTGGEVEAEMVQSPLTVSSDPIKAQLQQPMAMVAAAGCSSSSSSSSMINGNSGIALSEDNLGQISR